MKGVFFLVVFGLSLVLLTGCYTIPQHFAGDEETVYYPPQDYPPVYYPPEPYPPAPPPTYYPPPPPPEQTKVRKPDDGRNGESPGQKVRDPIRNHGGRGNDESNSGRR
jgi:hypothetical protein